MSTYTTGLLLFGVEGEKIGNLLLKSLPLSLKAPDLLSHQKNLSSELLLEFFYMN